jgi:hypothetical protein
MYFVVHAPRQTGKTTTLMALARALTDEGKLAALHFSCEAGEPAGDDYVQAQRVVLDAIRRRAESSLPPDLHPPEVWPPAADLLILASALSAWSARCPRPLVLIFDEIDALRGNSLRSVLRQLRTGYPDRPAAFPHSVILWPYTGPSGKREWQREAMELKVWGEGRPDPAPEGLGQLDAYLERLGLDEGAVVVFDRREQPAATGAAETRIEEARTPRGMRARVVRL